MIGAGQLTRHWNDHPDEAAFIPTLGERVVIIGNGNVAMDVSRILAKRPVDLDGSDMAYRHSDHIRSSNVRRIDIVGRSPAACARFDAVLVRELAHFEHVGFDIR